MGDYWLWHARPDYTQEFAEGIDEGVKSLFQIFTGRNTDSWTPIARERLRLPMENKGCGMQEAVDRSHGQFVGAMLQSIMPLMNRTDKTNCVIEGMLHIPASLVKDRLITPSSCRGNPY